MSDPIQPTAAALVAVLEPATAALGVTAAHWPFAPDDRVMPYLILDCLDAPEADGTFTGPTWTRQLWAIRVVTNADADLACDIAGAVNGVLEGASLTIGGYRNLVCTRERVLPPRPVQGDDSVTRIHAGGEYIIGVGEN